MRIIKAERLGPALIPAEVYDARNAAPAIRERAYHEGFAAGRADAAKQLFDAAALRRELLARSEREATAAVLLVAGELLGSTLQTQPELIVQLLAPHLTRLRRAERLVLRVHPEDASWLHDHASAVAELCQQQQLAGSLRIESDPAITRGGCTLESNLGGLDARVETRLQLLAAALGQPPTAAAPKDTP